jgi:SAM-dependent methyltransferase
VNPPLPFVTELAAICPPGTRVLDLGAGNGRHAIFLAQQGFRVDAVDSWVAGVEEMTAAASADSLPLRASVCNLKEALPDCHDYGAVLCTLVLHLLAPARATEILARARTDAAPGTVHAIAAITSVGDFAPGLPPGERYFPAPGEVARDYEDAGWELQVAMEEERSMRDTHADGTKKRNLVSFVIATRPTASRAQ